MEEERTLGKWKCPSCKLDLYNVGCLKFEVSFKKEG